MQVAWRAEAEEGGRSRALPTSWSHLASRMVSHYALTFATRAHELFHSAGDNIEEEQAVDDAMYALHALRSALKCRPNAKNCSQDLGGCGKTTNVCITVEERPFQGRVKHVESAWASAPVVVVPRKTAFFRSLLA